MQDFLRDASKVLHSYTHGGILQLDGASTEAI